MPVNQKGEAIQIISIKDNKLIFDTNAFRTILEKVGKLQMTIVSMNGPQRTGKSYLLRYFLKYLSNTGDKNWFNQNNDNEFEWKHTSDRQTTGIWMWSEPYIIRKSGDYIAVLLMDTQGGFDDNNSINESSLIFVISCILSSTVIYNIKEDLSEDILQFLQVFVDYAKTLTKSGKYESYSKLILMIRDWKFPENFYFGYHDSSGSPGIKNFKKANLDINLDEEDPHRNPPEEIQSTHAVILKSFQSVGCSLLSYPGNDFALNGDDSKLEKKFVNSVKDNIIQILNPCYLYIKNIGGQKVNGELMIKYVEELAKIFNNIEIPKNRSVDESNAEFQNVMAYKFALDFYKFKMDQILETSKSNSDDSFDAIHEQNMDKALELFEDKKSSGFDLIENNYKEVLKESILNAFEFYNNAYKIKTEFFQILRNDKEKEVLKEKIQSMKDKAFSPEFVADQGISKIIGLKFGCIISARNRVFGGLDMNDNLL